MSFGNEREFIDYQQQKEQERNLIRSAEIRNALQKEIEELLDCLKSQSQKSEEE